MAISFDGDDHLTKDYSGTGPISSYPFTMAAWFKPPEEYMDWQGFILSDGTETNRFGIGPANYSRWAIYQATGEHRTSGSFSENYTNSSPNDWAHAVGVFNASTGTGARTLYVNGRGNSLSHGTNNLSTLTDCDIVGLGYGPTSGNNRFYKGELAECGLWSAALTTAEIDSLNAGFSPLLIRPGSLVGYWPLGGAYSDYIDLIGQTTLSVTGDPTAAEHPRIIYPTLPQIGVPSGTVVPNAMHHYRMLRCS